MSKFRFKDKSLHIMDNNKEFVEDILKMIQIGSLNDIKIKLSDGEIVANKDILMARSEYFKTMFNNKFIESQTNCVDMRHCSKVIMDKIVNYFFSDMPWNLGDREMHWNDFDGEIRKLRGEKLIDIFQHLKETNHV